MSDEKSPLQLEYEALLVEEAQYEASERERKLKREVELMKLKKRFRAELGVQGVDWDVIDGHATFVVVKLGEAVLHKTFTEAVAKKGKPDGTDLDAFVPPNVVHPSREAYLELVGRKPAVAVRCANALIGLYGAADEVYAGKF